LFPGDSFFIAATKSQSMTMEPVSQSNPGHKDLAWSL